jgi:hypothetical protein
VCARLIRSLDVDGDAVTLACQLADLPRLCQRRNADGHAYVVRDLD